MPPIKEEPPYWADNKAGIVSEEWLEWAKTTIVELKRKNHCLETANIELQKEAWGHWD